MFGPVIRFGSLSLQGFAIAAVTCLSANFAFAESRVALVIGQSAYRTVTALPNPANDATAMSGLLSAAGFEVSTVRDVSQNELRQAVGDFAAKIAGKGPDTVALVFYAGHGVQIDGENFLMPVDVNIQREADVPLQAVRLNDVMNTLTSVPTKLRIVMLDACRNDPFDAINKTAGRGLAMLDAKANAAGSFISYSTSPGAEAEDGKGASSPYTSALVVTAREPGVSIEDAFKRVRVAVNKETDGRQIPWESSSLTSDFYFFPGPGQSAAKRAASRTVGEWRSVLQGKPAPDAYDLVIADDSIEAYEAFIALYTDPPFATRVRSVLDRRREMVAWSVAVNSNSVDAFGLFLASYPNSDLSATARKLQDRLRNRPQQANPLAANANTPGGVPNASSPAGTGGAPGPTLASLPSGTAAAAGPTCPCSQPPKEKKRAEPPPPPTRKRVAEPPPRRGGPRPPPGPPPEDTVIVRRRNPDADAAAAAAAGAIIGGAILGGALGGGGGGGGYRPRGHGY